MGNLGLLLAPTETFSIFLTVSMPSITSTRKHRRRTISLFLQSLLRAAAKASALLLQHNPGPTAAQHAHVKQRHLLKRRHLPEDNVFAIKPVACIACDEELAPVCVRSRVGH